MAASASAVSPPIASADRHPLKRLLRYTRPHRKQIWLASTYSVLNQLFDLAPPYLIGIVIDIVVQKEDSAIANLGIASVAAQLAFMAVATLLVWGGESLFQYLYDVKWRNLAQTVQHELRLDAYGHLQKLEMGFFEDRSSGELLSILNDDINQLERFLDSGANQLIQFATTVITISISLLVVAPGIAWMAMLPAPFILLGSVLYQKRLAPRYAEVRQQAVHLVDAFGIPETCLAAPIAVSPIGAEAFFSEWGLRVLASEAVWIGVPALAWVAAVGLWRRSREAPEA